MEWTETDREKSRFWREKEKGDKALGMVGEIGIGTSGGDASAWALLAIAKYLQIICDLEIRKIGEK